MEPTGGGALGRLSGAHSWLCRRAIFPMWRQAQVRRSLGSGPGSVRCLGLAHGEAGAPRRDPEGAWAKVCTVFVGAESHSSAVSKSSR